MNEQVIVQQTLHARFSALKLKNPAYSTRAFAKKLGLDPGALSGILNGKRRISHKLAERLAEKLCLDPQERTEFFGHFPERLPRKKEAAQAKEYLQLSADQFRVISDWQHFAILSLLATKDFKSDPAWIAKRFGTNEKIINETLDRLIRTELIGKDEKNQFVLKHPKVRTTDDIKNISLQAAHAKYLELAKNSLEQDDVNERDFTFMTMAIDKTKLPLAKEKIRKFQDELAELLECDSKTEVYTINIQLFPLTKS